MALFSSGNAFSERTQLLNYSTLATVLIFKFDRKSNDSNPIEQTSNHVSATHGDANAIHAAIKVKLTLQPVRG
jgi:hypothetical protein